MLDFIGGRKDWDNIDPAIRRAYILEKERLKSAQIT